MPCIARHRWLLAISILLLAALLATAASADELAQKFSATDPGSQETIDHAPWQALLDAYVKRGEDGLNRVDYARFKAEGAAQLDSYLEALQRVDVASLNRAEQFAFWVNLYNAKTVDLVLEHYPVPTIREIRLSGLFSPGPWKSKVVTVAGAQLSLDDIEHRILRPIWRDPRIHYAVNCAAVGCPNLMREAFTGATKDRLLEAAARDFIESPRGVRFKGEAVIVSKIYSWYKEDFGGDDASVLAHIRRYATGALAERLKEAGTISGYEYHWGLNDVI